MKNKYIAIYQFLNQALTDKINVKCNFNLTSRADKVELDLNLISSSAKLSEILKIENAKILIARKLLSGTDFGAEIKDMLARIGPGFLNILLNRFFKRYQFIKKIRVSFQENEIIILNGLIKRVIWWPFSIEMKLTLEKDFLVIHILSLKIVEIIPLPQFIKDILLKKLEEIFERKYIEYAKIEGKKIEINIKEAFEDKIKLNLKTLTTSRDHLTISTH